MPYTYYGNLVEMAGDVDVLIAITPGGPPPHLVNAAVLEALGPTGFFINVARGSVVDQDALVKAIEAGTIAGAGLTCSRRAEGAGGPVQPSQRGAVAAWPVPLTKRDRRWPILPSKISPCTSRRQTGEKRWCRSWRAGQSRLRAYSLR